ncbi:MAG: branched-chain amino acid transporter substrate-binding protein [Frankiales bacterium]|nr:branched-chain amino acid transporter substrate-binding protein [Frankiales bacterium]
MKLRTRNRALAAFGIVLASTLLAACSGSGSASSTDAGGCTVNTLLVANATGAQSSNGVAAFAAAKAATKYVNDNGGVNGCTLVLKTVDDGSDYTKTLPLMQAAMATTTFANVSVNDYGTASAVPYLMRQKVLSISANGTASLADPKTGPYYFDTSSPDATVSQYMTKYALSQGTKKFAVVADNTTTGASAIAAIKATAEAGGGDVVASVQVDATTVNMTPAVQQLSSSGADGVIISLYGQPAGFFIRDLKASGWNVQRYGSVSLGATNLPALLPVEDYQGIVVAGAADGSAPSLYGVADMQTQIKATGGDPYTSVVGLSQNYADILILANAINATKATDGPTLAKYLEDHGTDKIPGNPIAETTGYSSTNHQMIAPGSIATATEGPLDANGLLPRLQILN